MLDPSKSVTTGAPARAGGPGRGGVGQIMEPRKVRDVPPEYPPSAQTSGISGIVVLEAVIDRQGKVKDLQVLRSIPELDRAAMEAVSRWEYTPTLLAGVPIEVILTVNVTFRAGTAAPQMGRPVAQAWPSQPATAVRPGMGRGFVSAEIEIKQTSDALTMIRKFPDAREEIRYRFDGKPSRNRLPGTGGAVDNTYVYVSQWEGGKLISTISWSGPQGKRERTETIWLDGESLRMESARASTDPAAPPFVTTNVFNRKR